MKTVVVLGASDNPKRKSNEAVKLLHEKGYRVIPVNPNYDTIGEIPVMQSLAEVPEEPDVLSVYVNSERSSLMEDDILRLAPLVVIFNPGAENDELEVKLAENGIRVVHACTLVALQTNQFEKMIS